MNNSVNQEILKIVLSINDEYLAKAKDKRKWYIEHAADLRKQGLSKQKRDEKVGYTLKTIDKYINQCLKLRQEKIIPTKWFTEDDAERVMQSIERGTIEDVIRHLYQLNQFYV